MKKSIIIVCLFFVVLSANAQHLKIGGGLIYGTEAKADINTSNVGLSDFSDGALGLNLRAHLEFNKIGFLGGYNYFFNSDETQIVNGAATNVDSSLSQGFLDLTYKLVDLKLFKLYALGGANLTFASLDINDVSVDPDDEFGFEFGVNARVSPGIFGEIKYQNVDSQDQFVFSLGYMFGF